MTKIFAHRGASANAPENTMEAFELALEMGADGIELDVHTTADGKVVVCHDETIDRTSDGKGQIGEMTYDQLSKYNFHGKFIGKEYKIPLLKDVLALIKGTDTILNIELKGGTEEINRIEYKVLNEVEAAGMATQVLYSSFDHYCMYRLKQLLPTAKIGLLYSAGLYEPWLYASELRAHALHPKRSAMKRVLNFVKQSHEVGVEVNVWTLNSDRHINWALGEQVDGIITNVPDKAIALRDKR